MSGKGPPAMVVKAKEVVRGVRPKTVEIDVVLPPVTGDEIGREDVFEDRNAQGEDKHLLSKTN